MEQTGGGQVVAGSKGAEQGASVAKAIFKNCCTSWLFSSGALSVTFIFAIRLASFPFLPLRLVPPAATLAATIGSRISWNKSR